MGPYRTIRCHTGVNETIQEQSDHVGSFTPVRGQPGSNKVKRSQMKSNVVKRGQTGSNRANGAKQGQTGPNRVEWDKMRANQVRRRLKVIPHLISLITYQLSLSHILHLFPPLSNPLSVIPYLLSLIPLPLSHVLHPECQTLPLISYPLSISPIFHFFVP